MIDKIVKKAYNFSLFSSKRTRHEVAAQINLMHVLSQKNWNKRWQRKTKDFQYCVLILKVNHCYLIIYAKRFKAHSALMIQLRTEKIKFNQFLHERRIFDVLIAHWSYDNDYITIKHILLFCSNWKKERRKMLQRIKITNIKRMLSESKTMTITVCMILTTDLLNQFQTTKLLKKKNNSRS